MKWRYRCPACGAEYEMEASRYLCDACSAGQEAGKPLSGVLECVWDGVFRGGPDETPLPVRPEHMPPIPVGHTPLWTVPGLRELSGFPKLFIKDDTREPSGSFKDRASYLVAAFALERGIREISLASTGNAGSSMACIGAASGLSVTVFLPKAAPEAKRVQVLAYGARLVEVDGNYDQAYDASLEYSRGKGVLSRNTAYNPLTIEGKKSASFELVRDLAKALPELDSHYIVPDHIFVPVGDGVILAGLYKGFEDLKRMGRTNKMPTLWACQASGSSAVARALKSGAYGPAVPSATVADSVSVDVPRNGLHALDKLTKHGGRAVVVEDGQILEAQLELASRGGLFAEPSSALAWAGFQAAKSQLRAEDTVAVMVTGSGLKDTASALKALRMAEQTHTRSRA